MFEWFDLEKKGVKKGHDYKLREKAAAQKHFENPYRTLENYRYDIKKWGVTRECWTDSGGGKAASAETALDWETQRVKE